MSIFSPSATSHSQRGLDRAEDACNIILHLGLDTDFVLLDQDFARKCRYPALQRVLDCFLECLSSLKRIEPFLGLDVQPDTRTPPQTK
jgi:hypothetical protein